jgi:hypothetical protein
VLLCSPQIDLRAFFAEKSEFSSTETRGWNEQRTFEKQANGLGFLAGTAECG